MTLVPLVVAVEAYLHAHPAGVHAACFLAGGASTRPAECADAAFWAIEKTPLKYLFRKLWPKISAWVDAVQERFTVDIVAAEKADVVAPPPPAPPPIAP